MVWWLGCTAALLHVWGCSWNKIPSSTTGYWDERQRKLESQSIDDALFGALSSRMASGAQRPESSSDIFKNCCIYFDGRVDIGGMQCVQTKRRNGGPSPIPLFRHCPVLTGGLSAYALSKVARLHGATVNPRLAKRRVTHVVCTQLSGAKERHALRDASSAHAVVQYIVQPSWITESVAAGRRLQECQFSLMKKISQQFGNNTLSSHNLGDASRRKRRQQDTSTLLNKLPSLSHPCRVSEVTEVAASPERSDLLLVSDSPPSPSAKSQNMPPTAPDSEDGTQETELDTDAE